MDAGERPGGEEVTILWQTDEARIQRPRVVDEIRSGLWFFEPSLLDATPRLVADLRERVPDAPSPLRFGSWIGGYEDGNPAAGPETINEALERARVLALSTYRDEVRELARSLGISTGIVTALARAARLIARDERELPTYAAELANRNLDEPYRRKLSFVWRRLVSELERDGWNPATARPASSLETSRSSMRVFGETGQAGSLMDGWPPFGTARALWLPLAKLDVRLHARARRAGK